MTCDRCGSRTTNPKYCSTCASQIRREGDARLEHQFSTPDDIDLKCTACGTEYQGVTSTPCPDCGETRCRAIID